MKTLFALIFIMLTTEARAATYKDIFDANCTDKGFAKAMFKEFNEDLPSGSKMVDINITREVSRSPTSLVCMAIIEFQDRGVLVGNLVIAQSHVLEDHVKIGFYPNPLLSSIFRMTNPAGVDLK